MGYFIVKNEAQEHLRKLAEEREHDLNIYEYLELTFKRQVDIISNPFFNEYIGQFDGILNKKIYDDGVKVRQQVFDFLEKECSNLVTEYNNDNETFINKYGWYENPSAKIRHQITKDELAYDLCELIRKIYYVYLEDKFPEKYKISVNEQYLKKDIDPF